MARFTPINNLYIPELDDPSTLYVDEFETTMGIIDGALGGGFVVDETGVQNGYVILRSGGAWVVSSLSSADIAAKTNLDAHTGNTSNPHNTLATSITDFDTEVSNNTNVADSFQKSTDDLDDITTGTTNVHFTATEKSKLTGIEENATENDTDANLKNRANHTGTQLASTISDFQSAVSLNTNVADSFLKSSDTLDDITTGSTNLHFTTTKDGNLTTALSKANANETALTTKVETTDSRLSDSRTCDNTFDDASTARTNLSVYSTTETDALLDDKVDVVAGKQLSTEDYTTAEKSKLSGIATGATANSSDATLLARANHTGTQTASTISDFDTEVSNNTDVDANTTARHNQNTDTHTDSVTFNLGKTDDSGYRYLYFNSDSTTADAGIRLNLDSSKMETKNPGGAWGEIANATASTSLAGLTDVTLGSLSDQEVLTYVSGNSRWENARIKMITKSAAEWTSSGYILQLGQWGYDSTNDNPKVGDGVSDWDTLPDLAVGTGEANTASNDASGTGEGVYKTKAGVNLVFKTIKGIGDTTVTSDSNNVIISSTNVDVNAKVSSNDTTSDYLENKLIGTTNNITVTVNNEGGNENLQFDIGSNVFDTSTDTLDDILNGSTYVKVTSTDNAKIHTQNTDTGTNVNTFTLGDNSDTTKKLEFDTGFANNPSLQYNATSDKVEVSHNGTTFNTIATIAGTEILTNKYLSDSTTYFIDEGDDTKRLQLQLSGITTSNDRIATVPDRNFTFDNITTSTTSNITGILKSNGTNISQAVNGQDYLKPASSILYNQVFN